MKTRAEQLALKRTQLLAKCLLQRAELSMQMQPLKHDMQSVEVGLRILDRVRQHPGWLAAAAFGVMLVRPRRLSSLLRLGSAGLRSWRTLGPGLQALLPR
ncbi:MAG TPA: YqjK family protein [Noviherbaspirillum sp.]|uniref:YqjK family protein n=1 Tax=Noviherbaspirillum sp. TaxID=1926288 RepID=UPI002B4A189E|nr:YqjK family protein [Noviherbaspirillum sp.]HJV84772.1 YqjK family protein [Noviherbaspirillum sp.]